MLQCLQSVVLQEQTALFLKSAATCHGCGARLGTKTTRSLVYRTAFGKVKLDSPQLYSRCAHCGSRHMRVPRYRR
jgi:DNA-directed RNA polymerase subunit RPC12/RpoP